eukprot:8191728-Alexandrium_andersonii.AAC.1
MPPALRVCKPLRACSCQHLEPKLSRGKQLAHVSVVPVPPALCASKPLRACTCQHWEPKPSRGSRTCVHRKVGIHMHPV